MSDDADASLAALAQSVLTARAAGSSARALFNCPPSASVAEVRARFKALARRLHPDKVSTSGASAATMALATEAFQLLAAALEAVSAEPEAAPAPAGWFGAAWEVAEPAPVPKAPAVSEADLQAAKSRWGKGGGWAPAPAAAPPPPRPPRRDGSADFSNDSNANARRRSVGGAGGAA